MTPRRGLALVMTVVSAAVMTSAAVASAGAASSTKICVALVVDGRALGSDVSTSCAKVSKGATGVDVLEAGGHTVGFRNDGLLCTIDGLPKTGCAGVDDTHYWAYFHRAPGKTRWTYSTEGSSTYQPVNDSTEGWVYDDGKALTPDNVPYSQICKDKSSPSPAPTRSRAPTPTATPTHHRATAPASKPASPSPTPTVSPTERHRHHAKPAKRTHATTIASSPTPSRRPTSAALTGAVPPPSSGHGGLELAIGVVIVAALGIAAALRFRRARR